MMTYFRMKRYEWKVKAMLFGAILTVMENRRGTLTMLQKLFASLKDVPEDELQNQFVEKLAEIIHAEHQQFSERRN